MREKKSYLFHNEEGDERNVVHSLLKTLQDTQDIVTADFLEIATGTEAEEWGTDLQYEYRTEVTETNPQEEPRYLVGLSTDDLILDDEPGDADGRIDGRIQIYDGDIRQATIFIEAKFGSNSLREGQLRRYATDFEITETGNNEPWRRIQWADVYKIFREHINSERYHDPRNEWAVDEYLLTEFSEWLRYKNQIQLTVGNGTINDEHVKHLNVGVNEDEEYYIQLFSESRKGRKKSATSTISEPIWKRFLNKIDKQIRREMFGVPTDGQSDPNPNLHALRDWLLNDQDYEESDFEEGSCWVWEIDRPSYPLKIKFVRSDNIWIRTKPKVRYCPELASGEFKKVFDDVDPEIREAVFIDGELEPLWESRT